MARMLLPGSKRQRDAPLTSISIYFGLIMLLPRYAELAYDALCRGCFPLMPSY